MDILFTRKYKYIVNESIDNVRNDFTKVTGGRWFDFSNNTTGTLNDDNSFKLTHKWALGYITGLGGKGFACLKGKIIQEGYRTIIETTLRPNIGLILFFYFTSVLFLCELVGIKTMLEGPRIPLVFILLITGLILIGLILMTTNGLRNRFERIMQLTRDA